MNSGNAPGLGFQRCMGATTHGAVRDQERGHVGRGLRTGPPAQPASHQGHYSTATTRRADAALQALLALGMHPDAMRHPFPSHINAPGPRAWRSGTGRLYGKRTHFGCE